MTPSRSSNLLWLGLLGLLVAGCDQGPPEPAAAPVLTAVHSTPATPEHGAQHEHEALAPVDPSQPDVGTTLAIVRVSPSGCELVRAIAKPELQAAQSGRARFVAEDALTGEVLGEGSCPWPNLCPCPRQADHAQGCVRRAHEAVVRLKLPYHPDRAQRVRVYTQGEQGWSEVGVFSLPVSSRPGSSSGSSSGSPPVSSSEGRAG